MTMMKTILAKIRNALVGPSQRARNAEEAALRREIAGLGEQHAAAVLQISLVCEFLTRFVREGSVAPAAATRRRRGPRSSGRTQLA